MLYVLTPHLYIYNLYNISPVCCAGHCCIAELTPHLFLPLSHITSVTMLYNTSQYIYIYYIYILTLPCACLCVCDQNTPSKAERREMANSILAISLFAKNSTLSVKMSSILDLEGQLKVTIDILF